MDDKDWDYFIDDWSDKELSDEEKTLLAELDEKKLIDSPGRKVEGYSDRDAQRNKIFKTLVYKDLISFTIGKPHHYVFISRTALGGRRL